MKKALVFVFATVFSVAAQAAIQEIDISDMRFNPTVIDINQGDTVRWINRDMGPHVIQGAFGTSPSLAPEERFEFTFNEAGNFDYICQIHPSMTGTIRVAAVSEPASQNDDDNALNFSALFGTGEFEPENLAVVNQDFPEMTSSREAMDSPATEETFFEPVTETVSAPPAQPPASSPVVETQTSTESVGTLNSAPLNRSVAASSTTESLPTAGGDNWWIYVGVLGLLGFLAVGRLSRR